MWPTTSRNRQSMLCKVFAQSKTQNMKNENMKKWKMMPKWSQNDPKMMPKWSQNDPKMLPSYHIKVDFWYLKLASFASKIGWWQCFRARALGTQGYRYESPGTGARAHRPKTLPPTNFKPPFLHPFLHPFLLKILTPGIRRSLGGSLFGGFGCLFVFFLELFLQILTPGIRRSLGGALFSGLP